MNFCRDCKHAEGDLPNLRCGNEKNSIEFTDAAQYAVTGDEQPAIMATLAATCTALRRQGVHPTLGIELCGPDGVWWEAKE